MKTTFTKYIALLLLSSSALAVQVGDPISPAQNPGDNVMPGTDQLIQADISATGQRSINPNKVDMENPGTRTYTDQTGHIFSVTVGYQGDIVIQTDSNVVWYWDNVRGNFTNNRGNLCDREFFETLGQSGSCMGPPVN